MPRRDLVAVDRRSLQPRAQPPAAHRGLGRVEPLEQGPLPAAAAQRAHHLEVGERGVVEHQEVVLLDHLDLAHVEQLALLRAPRVVERDRGGERRRLRGVESEALDAGGLELALEQAARSLGAETVVGFEQRPADALAIGPLADRRRQLVLGEHQLARAEHREVGDGVLGRSPAVDQKLAGGDVEKGAGSDPAARLGAVHPGQRAEKIVFLALRAARARSGFPG